MYRWALYIVCVAYSKATNLLPFSRDTLYNENVERGGYMMHQFYKEVYGFLIVLQFRSLCVIVSWVLITSKFENQY